MKEKINFSFIQGKMDCLTTIQMVIPSGIKQLLHPHPFPRTIADIFGLRKW